MTNQLVLNRMTEDFPFVILEEYIHSRSGERTVYMNGRYVPQSYDELVEKLEEVYREPSPEDDNMTDVEADADTLRSAGMGTDEDYNLGNYADPDW